MTQTSVQTISITRALAQVKSLNDRIARASNANFITTSLVVSMVLVPASRKLPQSWYPTCNR